MDDEFRIWLSKELEKRRLSHNELAKQAKLSQPVVSRVLSGKRNPTADFCIKVAQALDEPPEKVLRLARILPDLPAPDNDPILANILENLRDMSSDQREEALRYIEYLRRSQ